MSAAMVAGSAAAPAMGAQLEEIVVTATKREESVMDVPLAVQALSGDFLRDANLDDVKDLVHFTPGVTGNSKDSFLDAIRVRGIVTNDFGNGGDPSIGVYKNGFYQGRNGAGVVSLFDTERAEILRGPQNFLFGRNSISGAMNIFTVRPTIGDPDAYVDARFGERGVFVVEGAFNQTLTDSFAVRLAAYHSEEDGYVENVVTGNDFIEHDKDAFRLTGLWDNGGPLTVVAMVEVEDREQSGTIYRATGEGGSYALLESIYGELPVPNDPRDVAIDEPDNGIIDNGEHFSAQLEVNYDLPWGTFTSLTGFKNHDYHYTEDFDATALTIFNYEQIQDGEYFEQEFRITSDTDGMFSWYAGASYYEEDIDTRFLGQQDEDLYCNVYWGDTCQGVFDFYNNYYGGAYAYVLQDYFGTYTWTPSPTGRMDDWNETKGDFRGWATYVDLNWQFTPAWDLSLGARYTWDEKKMSQEVLTALNPSPVLGNRVQTGFTTSAGPISETLDWNKTTWRAALNFRPNDDTLLFGTVTTGYKQGGFNSFNVSPGGSWGAVDALPGTHVPGSFDGEQVISYELGYKGSVLDRRGQIQLNAFFYDYEDLQSTCTTPGTPGVEVCNVGQVDGYGLEGTFTFALGENWTFGTGFAYFDSEADGVQEFCDEGELIFGTADACEGQSIPGAPEWTFFANLDANFPVRGGAWYGNLFYSWEDETRASWVPINDQSRAFPFGNRYVNEYSELQGMFGFRSEAGWALAVYGENLLDDEYYDSGGSGGNPANPYVQSDISPSRPRTLGVRFSYDI
ncbi:MAG: TonB-dependent receptor [Gammaproteobacteria bacterium]|nr:TonB-dependent receptor [Gammaproteobacteria bacterium]